MTGSLIFAAGILLLALLFACVHFVPPKRVHVITFLGTTPIAKLPTGIHFTIPRPFAQTTAVIPTDVNAVKMTVQIKSRDNLVFELPATVQFQVQEAMKFAFERDEPIQQMENLVVAALRSASNRMEFQEIYNDKTTIQTEVNEMVAAQLASFGIAIVDLVIDDPVLPDTTMRALNGIREAEWKRHAAEQEAEARRVLMVGEARAEAESTLLKAKALAGFRMEIAEGNAAAIAVMQGKIGVRWMERTFGEGESAQTVKVPVYVDRTGKRVLPPQIDLPPETILEFFKVVDGNDAIRDAASKQGTVIITPAGGSSGERDLANWVAADRARASIAAE